MRTKSVLMAAVLLSGCASPTTYTLRSEPIGHQIATSTAGLVSVQSAWPGSTVTISPEDSNLEGALRLRVIVDNTSDRPADFGTENVLISYDGRSWVPATSFLEMKSTLDGDAAFRRGVADVVDTMTIGLLGSSNHDNPNSGQQQEIADTVADVEKVDTIVDEEHDAEVAELKRAVLQTTTVAPGYVLEGHVVADAPPLNHDHPTPIFVKIDFGGDTHIVKFDVIGPWNTGTPVPVQQNEIDRLMAKEAQSNSAAGAMQAEAGPKPIQSASCTSDDAVAEAADKDGFQYHSPCR